MTNLELRITNLAYQLFSPPRLLSMSPFIDVDRALPCRNREMEAGIKAVIAEGRNKGRGPAKAASKTLGANLSIKDIMAWDRASEEERCAL